MLKKIDKRKIFKELLIYSIIIFASISLSNVRIFYNNFVFIVPFVIFCFMNDKWYGYASFLSSFFVVGSYNKWFYLSYLLLLLVVFIFKCFGKKDNSKFKNVISFLSFFVVAIEGALSLLVYNSSDYLMVFLLGVISYWIMRYFYDLYINIHVSEKRYLTPHLMAFVFAIIGISFLGLYINNGWFSISLILIVFLSFISSRISLETGVLYSFIMIVMFEILNIRVNDLLFLVASLVCFLLSKVSKITLLFTYSLIVFSFLYYQNINYLIGVNYCLGALCFVFVPNKIGDFLSKKCYGSDKYIEKINKDNKCFNLEISKKILKMEEVFSLVSSKLNIKGRLRKCEKELLIEEINIFDNLLKGFANEINDRFEHNYYSNLEKEIYKYGYDLLYLEVKEDIFKDLVIDINIRCDKKEVYKVIKPLISKVVKKNFSVSKIKFNEIFEYYEVRLKEEKDYKFNYGIKQRAKDKETCGDSYLVYENDRKIIYALSDGMGIGKQAKEKSKQALNLFKKFMDIGFEEEKTINSINCILKSEYNKDSYATLDLFIYDKYLKEFYFYKNGASDSFILNDKEIINIEGDKLPIGIMDKVEVGKRVVQLNKGDRVVMVSDGVSERKINKFKSVKNNNPVNICDEILKDDNDINDDESIIVIKIK